MKIYISGLYSGTNPQPGIGVARSLRMAYPSARLVGVEYSNRCSGIHWPDFDKIILNRSWQELDLDSHASKINEILQAGSFWISCNDLEILWLAKMFPEGHQNLLTPPTSALEQVSKPVISAHEKLPVKIPPYLSTENSEWDLHAFCRQHNWKVWLKGPYYEAVRIHNWSEFQAMRTLLSNAWSTDKLFLQAHVTGYEESICLSAYRGALVGSVKMRKRDLTDMSKTWAGDVTELTPEVKMALVQTIKDLNWTGGAELEMVRDADEQLWLLEINPRYPAWVHGATITGTNLPGALIEAASGVRALKARSYGEEFTRVVLEIPVRTEFPLPSLPEPFAGGVGHSLKHPSGLLGFANKLHKLESASEKEKSAVTAYSNRIRTNGQGNEHDVEFGLPNSERHLNSPFKDQPTPPHDSLVEELSTVNFETLQTPAFVFLNKAADKLFEKAAEVAADVSARSIDFKCAYSIKTNPDQRMIALALKTGFLAEAISPLEVERALDVGFQPEQIILNGPGKWWRQEKLPSDKLHAIFCDSIPDLKRVVLAVDQKILQAKILGVRLRTPNIPSRFGIPVHEPELFQSLIEAIKLLPKDSLFGIHFHMASSNIGVKQWWHMLDSMLQWCSSIETLAGRTIDVLDIGGGWFPDDWNANADHQFETSTSRIKEILPHVQQVIVEPGKALAQPAMALAMRILEIQEAPEIDPDVIVDGSIAELPMAFFQPHRMLHQNSATGKWRSLSRGKAQLLGRLCMEHDIVASNIKLPVDAKPGDVILFCDAGAYDRSMSYVFGCG